MNVQHRTTVSAGGGTNFVISDGSRDRHGTRINPNGWDLTSFRKNPIALFGHSGGFPIGKWSDVRVVKDALVGTLVFAAAGTSARIDELRSLVEQGILRSVSVGFSVLEEGQSGKSEFDFERQELLEASLVSVPSNTNALAMARSLNISDETMSLVFGEQAETRRRDVSTGEHAETVIANEKRSRVGLPPLPKAKSMTTLSERIENAQNDLNAKRDKLAELSAAETLDLDAIEELNVQAAEAERAVSALKGIEQRIGINAVAKPILSGEILAPAINRRPLGYPQREVSGFDLMVRKAAVLGCAYFGKRSVDRVLDDFYPGHEATSLLVRADQTIGTTTVSGWASELVQTQYADFMPQLDGVSIYPTLRSRGMAFSFDGAGTVSIPSTTGAGAGGGFVAEGAPIRVGRITTAAVTMTARKLAVIVPFSNELAKRSRPQVEQVVRQRILADTSVALDSALLDATAGDTARPAGLLNGVAATSVGFGGGDFTAVTEDFKALMAPFIAANAADNITVIMNPAQGMALGFMPGPGDGRFGWASALTGRFNIVESTHATAGRLIAIRNSDFATALDDAPQFDISDQATVHMEDTTPLEIVSGTGPTTADPVRSFWQTNTVGVRMIMYVSWKMARTGMVAWINGTSW